MKLHLGGLASAGALHFVHRTAAPAVPVPTEADVSRLSELVNEAVSRWASWPGVSIAHRSSRRRSRSGRAFAAYIAGIVALKVAAHL